MQNFKREELFICGHDYQFKQTEVHLSLATSQNLIFSNDTHKLGLVSMTITKNEMIFKLCPVVLFEFVNNGVSH